MPGENPADQGGSPTPGALGRVKTFTSAGRKHKGGPSYLDHALRGVSAGAILFSYIGEQLEQHADPQVKLVGSKVKLAGTFTAVAVNAFKVLPAGYEGYSHGKVPDHAWNMASAALNVVGGTMSGVGVGTGIRALGSVGATLQVVAAMGDLITAPANKKVESGPELPRTEPRPAYTFALPPQPPERTSRPSAPSNPAPSPGAPVRWHPSGPSRGHGHGH